MEKFTGFPLDNFKSLMIDYWMSEGIFSSRQAAIKHYGGPGFNKLCTRCDGKVLLTFIKDTDTTCFEEIDNDYVIPISAINIYK